MLLRMFVTLPCSILQPRYEREGKDSHDGRRPTLFIEWPRPALLDPGGLTCI